MKSVSSLVVLPLALSAFAQTHKITSPPIVERLCGKLQRSELLPIKDELNAFTMKTHDLRHVVVNLYPAAEDSQCCEAASVIATTVTGHWGSFSLKTKRLPGELYWLEIQPDGRKSSVLVRYAPKKYSDQLCTETWWDVDGDGKMRAGWGTITVD